MAKKNNRTCLTCGTTYSYCSNCNKKDPAWMAEFHDENCKNIFDICTRFNMQLLTKPEAKTGLEKCDLSNKANFKDYVQRDLDAILAEDPFVVTVGAKNKESNEDKTATEAVVRSNNKKKSHEVVNKEENK